MPKKIVITGTFKDWSRSELKKELESRGAIVTNSVTSKTDILIAGDKSGSKLQKAELIGVQVLDSDALLTLFST